MFDLGSALSPILEMLESVSFSAVLLASGVFPVGDGADLLTGLGVKVLIALDLRWIWPRLPLDGPDSSDSSPGSEGRALAILASTRSKITEWICRLSGSENFADSFGVLEAGGRGRYPPLLRVFIGPRSFCLFSLPRTNATSTHSQIEHQSEDSDWADEVENEDIKNRALAISAKMINRFNDWSKTRKGEQPKTLTMGEVIEALRNG